LGVVSVFAVEVVAKPIHSRQAKRTNTEVRPYEPLRYG
jgi:hypothetical protein